MMRKAVVVAAMCAMCAAVFAGAPVELVNAGFEQTGKGGYPVGWSRHPNWHGERAGHNGSGGLVFECAKGEEQKKGRPQQLVKLEAGKRYYVSALVKATGIVTERNTAAQGVGLYLDCYGADGKWKFGGGPRKFATGTTKDWVKVEFITKPVPEGIVRAYVQPWARKCVSGRAVIDNVYVAEYEMKPVAGLFSDAYRNESCGGTVRFSASLNLDLKANSLADYSAEFTYAGADGRRVQVPAAPQSGAEATVALDVSRFAPGTNDVTFALALKGRVLGSATLRFVRLPEPSKRKVRIDSMKRAIVDGKPFFPLGMYFRNRDLNATNLSRYVEGPFNCVMPYAPMGLSEKDLAMYRAAGLKVIFDLRHGTTDADGAEAWVRKTVAKFKDDPALLAWYTNDERPVSDIPKLAFRQRLLEEIDPDHPTWSVQDVFSEARQYMGTYDVLGMDPYPIPKKPIETAISSMRQGLEGTFGARAVWQVPQAFGWGWLKRKETKGQRAPTQKEMANMTWQAIAGGANGIVYYAFQHLYEKHDDPADAFAPAWARTKAAASEVKKYESVLLSGEEPPPVSGATDAVAVRTWRHGGDTYLLAVNCTTNAQSATLALPERIGKIVAVDFGPAPRVEGSTIDVSFGPIDYVMLQIRNARMGEKGSGSR